MMTEANSAGVRPNSGLFASHVVASVIGVIVYEFSRQMLLAEQTLALVAPLITDGSED